MTRYTANGRWIHCDVNGKEMKVTSRDANDKIVTNECFTLYASPMSNCGATFNCVNENGSLTASVDNKEIIASHKQINLNLPTPSVYFCHIQKDKQVKVVKVVKK